MHKFGVIICMLPRDYSAKLALFGKIAKSTGQEENRNGPNLLGLRCSHWASWAGLRKVAQARGAAGLG